MKTTFMMLLAGACTLATIGIADAQTKKTLTNPTNKPPGQMMNSTSSRGASSYTPGHEMNANGSRGSSSGASGYAPGHAPATTTTRTR